MTTFDINLYILQDTETNEYVGICKELGLVIVGKDEDVIAKDLKDASVGYVQTVIENNLPKSLLKQDVPEEYREVINFIDRKHNQQKMSKLRKVIAQRRNRRFINTTQIHRQIHANKNLCQMV